MKISQKAQNAIKIGVLCSVSYFAVYVAKNILGAVTPQMTDSGYTKEYIGYISSLYLAFYAFGQLINGMIGDKIKAKWMISIGLFGAAVTNFVFSLITATPTAAMIVYGLTGYFLSMIYGPMTKVVAENTDPLHATRCSLGYTFAALFGSPAAGLLAACMTWQSVFAVSSSALIIMATLVALFFTLFERQKIIRYGQYKTEKKGVGNIGVLLKRDIIKFALISILTGVIRTSVVQWLTTYFQEHLGYAKDTSALIFSITTLIIAFAAFLAVFIYERLGHNMNKAILIFFVCALILFTVTYFVQHPIVNIVLFVLSIMASNSAATMLWSRYCPSLRDTGMVSSATGFLDFLSYMAAAAANLFIPIGVRLMGWNNLTLVWAGLMLAGVAITLPYKRIFEKRSKNCNG